MVIRTLLLIFSLSVSAETSLYESDSDSASININQEDEHYRVSGNAAWVSPVSDSVHDGEFKGITQFDSVGVAFVKDRYCELVLYKTNSVLFVNQLDNSDCGGMNVSFSGKYIEK